MRRLNRKAEEEETGMMGIGTIIIFIAIVLVAAVTAGVFIETVTMLKSQAEQSSSQAMAEVSTFLNVRSIYGETNEERTEIEEIRVNMGLGPGSPPQNLEFTLIDVVGREKSEPLEYINNTLYEDYENDDYEDENISEGNHYFTAEAVMDPHDEFDHDTNPIMEAGATLQIRMNATKIGLDLGPQSMCELHFTPKHGATVLESFYTPTVYNRRMMALS